MILRVRQNPDPVLRQLAQAVPISDLPSPWLDQLIAKMSATLSASPDGVALAAPQIGEAWRVFIVGRRAFPERDLTQSWSHDLVFVNPIITRRSRRQIECTEGCLSVKDYYGVTRRYERVSVAAFDATGKKLIHHASGLMAQVFQHEIEHLDGVLFIDHARNVVHG
ncbi:MAG: peptide deformylase [Patescibacteria group bacterium]